MKNFKNILVKNIGHGIISLKINDPKTYNSLSTKTLTELLNTFKKLNNDREAKVIILEGSGNGFSAGHNLKEVRGLKKRAKHLRLFTLCSKLMLQIVEGRKPVIAKVHGAAYAAGCQLVASCDLAYSTNEATFATPGVNIGLFCSTPMVAVSRKVNRKETMKMLLTGEPIKANYAKEIGLINGHFSKSKLNNEVLKIAKNIASKSNLIIKIGKQGFYKQLEMPLRKAYAYTSKRMTLNMMAADAKEGISAFLEKRKPKEWKIMSDEQIKEILKNSKTIAMIGVSSEKKGEDPKNLKRKPANVVMKYMQDFGYKVIPVNPFAVGEKINGEIVVGSLKEISEAIDIVDVFRPSKETPGFAKEALNIGAKTLWLQYGIQHEETKKIAEDAKVKYIENKCIKQEYQKLFEKSNPVFPVLRY